MPAERGTASDHDERILTVTMPKWGLSMTTGKIVDIHVAEGDTLARLRPPGHRHRQDPGNPRVVGGGAIRRLVAGVGDELPVGAVLAVAAPPEELDAEIDLVVEEARAAAESGELDVPDEPQPQLVEIDGRTISYLTLAPEEPSGAPIVLVHGFGGDKNSWLFVQQPLAEEHAVHAVDLPGHGASGKDVGDGSLAGLADVLVGFLDALGISRAHLVGHSLGGAVVAAAARSAPEKVVASLTLLAPAGYGPDADAEYLRGFAAAVSRRELKPLVGRLFADPSLVTRQLVDDLLRYKRLDGVDKALSALLGTLLDGDRQAIDTPALLDGVDVPVTVVWGSADRILPPPEGTGERVGAGHAAHGGGERRGPGAAGARSRVTSA